MYMNERKKVTDYFFIFAIKRTFCLSHDSIRKIISLKLYKLTK